MDALVEYINNHHKAENEQAFNLLMKQSYKDSANDWSCHFKIRREELLYVRECYGGQGKYSRENNVMDFARVVRLRKERIEMERGEDEQRFRSHGGYDS